MLFTKIILITKTFLIFLISFLFLAAHMLIVNTFLINFHKGHKFALNFQIFSLN